MGYSDEYPTGRKFKRDRREHRSHEPNDYASIDPELLRGVIRWIAKSGGAVRFGLTRDQGAFAIGIYGEGDPYTEYMHSTEDLTEFLLELVRDYRDDDGNAEKMPVKGTK